MVGETFLKIVSGWRGLFARASSFERSIALSIGLLCTPEDATTINAIVTLGRDGGDWSADYKLFSRAPWEAEKLFDCVVQAALPRVSSDWVVLAYDDTRLKKSGNKIVGAQYFIDPCAKCKAFHPNLMYGLAVLATLAASRYIRTLGAGDTDFVRTRPVRKKAGQESNRRRHRSL
jgi:hypothetical protein